MLVIFCAHVLSPREVDAAYLAEWMAVKQTQGSLALIRYEVLVDDGEPMRAVRGVPHYPEPTLAVYRGWMLRPAQYALLYEALTSRNVFLINDPPAYRHAHYLPESYAVIQAHTPTSVWLQTGKEVSIDAVMDALRPFGAQAVIVKDFVKSQKHRWTDACFIPSADDRSAVEAVVRRFLDLQGDDLSEGLVFRAYVELAPLALHVKSGMPLTEECRIFYLDGVPIYKARYWDQGEYGTEAPPQDLFRDVAQQVRSRFFTMDVAVCRTGDWTIIELGDGQVSGLPEAVDVRELYATLKTHWPEAGVAASG